VNRPWRRLFVEPISLYHPVLSPEQEEAYDAASREGRGHRIEGLGVDTRVLIETASGWVRVKPNGTRVRYVQGADAEEVA